jgi:hypothetical protein
MKEEGREGKRGREGRLGNLKEQAELVVNDLYVALQVSAKFFTLKIEAPKFNPTWMGSRISILKKINKYMRYIFQHIWHSHKEIRVTF